MENVGYRRERLPLRVPAGAYVQHSIPPGKVDVEQQPPCEDMPATERPAYDDERGTSLVHRQLRAFAG